MRQQRKKILFVITKGNWGGAQRYVFDLATALPKNEYEVEVALGGKGLLSERLKTAGVKTVSIPELQRDISVVKEIRSFLSLYNIIKRTRPDIVHLNSSKAAGLGVLAARLVRMCSSLLRILNVKRSTLSASQIIFTVHGWPFNERRNWLWKILVWLASYITALLSTDVVVITSHDCKEARAMPYISAKTRFIPNGIRAPVFLPRGEARRELDLPQEARVVGSIGERTGNKNYAGLVAATRRLQGTQAFILTIIGGRANSANVAAAEERLELSGRQIFVGFKADAYRYLKAFDVFVLPSLKEGLPYVLLEAGAAAVPVVATAVGGVPDIIGNEATGLLVPPNNTECLLDALLTLLRKKETRERLGHALKKRVEKEFSFERMLTETQKLYTRKLS